MIERSPLVYLADDDLSDLADFTDAIDALEAGFRDLGSGTSENLPRQRLAPGASIFNVMVAGTPDFYGLKAYTVSKHGAPMVVLLFAGDGTGLRAIMAAGWFSKMRTGAASGLSARWLARRPVRRIGVIGSGGQALSQIEALVAATRAESIQVFSRDETKRSTFAHHLAKSLGVAAFAVGSAREAAANAEVVVTITNSQEPVLTLNDVEPGTHIIAAGNNHPARAELDPEILAHANCVVVDDVAQALDECGEIRRAMESNGLLAEQLVPLASVVAGSAVGRRADSDITVFESQGIALEDVTFAAHLYRKAVALGRGLAL